MWRAGVILSVLLPGALVALSAQSVRVWTPADAFLLAAADVRQFPPSTAEYRRYFFAPEEPEQLRAALSVQLHHLSHEPDAYPPVAVAGSGGTLLRVDLHWYGIDGYVFGSLAEPDPYFHVLQVAGEKKTAAIAPWVLDTPQAQQAAAFLVEKCQTRVPVLRADWFIWQTAVQQDRHPGYYDFLGVKNLKDFENLIGFDAEILKRFPIELAETVANSSVTQRQKPRAIVRFGKVLGGYWKTLDVARPVDKANPIRVLDPAKNLEATAFEVLGHNPFGLMYTGLFAAKDGTRQDTAPPNIAFDHMGGANNDFNVHAGTISCNRCHDKLGLNSIRGYVRGKLMTPPLGLNAALVPGDEKESIRRRRIYTADLAEALDDDRRIVGRALTKCTGLPPEKALAALVRVWEEYEQPVSLERAARELGTTPQVFQAAIHRQLAATNEVDPVLAAYVRPEWFKNGGRNALRQLASDPPEPMHRDVWNEAYPLAQYLLRGLRPVQIQKGRP